MGRHPQMRHRKFGRSRPHRWARNTAPNLGITRGKVGCHRLVERPALELAGDGITLNALAPGAVETDRFFNQPTYDVFLPDIATPRCDFAGASNELAIRPQRSAVPQPGTLARAAYLSPTGVLITGQVAGADGVRRRALASIDADIHRLCLNTRLENSGGVTAPTAVAAHPRQERWADGRTTRPLHRGKVGGCQR